MRFSSPRSRAGKVIFPGKKPLACDRMKYETLQTLLIGPINDCGLRDDANKPIRRFAEFFL
jgi:hypothetical protein